MRQVLSAGRIRHKPVRSRDEVEGEGWLPAGAPTVGVTAGASTPDVVIGAVVERVAALAAPPA